MNENAKRIPAHRGELILVFGILSFVVCAGFGVAAWIMGKGDLQKIDAGQMAPEGRGLTNAGKICGMISVILNIIVFAFIAVCLLVVLIAGNSTDTLSI